MSQRDIKRMARSYPRSIEWSESDQCYIGTLRDLDGIRTHGDTPEKVARLLDQCAEIYIADCLESGLPLPEPSPDTPPPEDSPIPS